MKVTFIEFQNPQVFTFQDGSGRLFGSICVSIRFLFLVIHPHCNVSKTCFGSETFPCGGIIALYEIC